MASDINRVILIGRLTRDSELKSTNSGGKFCRFSLASNRNIYNKQTGESRDEVGFFEATIWGRSGEAFAKYTKKGSKVCIEGRLHWSSWEKDGKTFSKVDIAVDSFQFLDAKQEGGGNSGAASFDSGAMSDDDLPPF